MEEEGEEEDPPPAPYQLERPILLGEINPIKRLSKFASILMIVCMAVCVAVT